MSRRNSRTIYVGNLPGDIRKREVEDLFYKYGHIVDIDLKIPPRPPGYAFVEFEDPYDAEDAIYGCDGYNYDGRRLRVELAHGGRGPSSFDQSSSYSSGGRRGTSRRSDYRVMVTGLPSSASWQDLKDYMRRAGDVCFSDVYREAGDCEDSKESECTEEEDSQDSEQATIGIVDYTSHEDMKHAVREYDARRSSSPSRGRNRSRSYSRSRNRSPSYSRSGSRSYSRSRSPRSRSPRSHSPIKARSRSASQSRSPVKARSPSRSQSPATSPPRDKSASRSPARSRSLSRSRSPVKSE